MIKDFLCANFSEIVSYGFYIIIALIALLIMITIHEFGHFIVGKKLGFKINEFAIGFGKAIFKKKTKDGIIVSLRIIPLGGYCAFEGESEECQVVGAFNTMAPWKRLLVLFSGAFFNFLSAIIMSFVLLLSVGYADVVQVASISDKAKDTNLVQLQENDVIYAVDGVETNFVYDNYFTSLVKNVKPGTDVTITIKRDGELKDIQIELAREVDLTLSGDAYEFKVKDNVYKLFFQADTVTLLDTQNGEIELNEKFFDNQKYYSFTIDDNSYALNFNEKILYDTNAGLVVKNYKYSFFEALGKCIPFTFEWGWKILTILFALFTGQIGIDALGGPVTTITSIATYTQANWQNLIILFPIISINLAVFNWLPIPALDGARMVFVLIEWIRGKPVNRNVESIIHSVGLMLLFAFVIIIDILHFIL